MGFRQRKPDPKQRRAWDEWIDQRRPELRGIGLPPEVYLTLEHWQDFLENGYLEWHPQDRTGFEFGHLSHEQMVRLYDFLERHPEFRPGYCPMLGWLRIRLGREGSG